MTSPSPLLYDTHYHIYNRGVNGENIFVEERNYDLFLKLVEKHLFPIVDLFAYCLLKNHFHMATRVKAEEEILGTEKTLRLVLSLSKGFRVQTVINPAEVAPPTQKRMS